MLNIFSLDIDIKLDYTHAKKQIKENFHDAMFL